MIASFLNLPGLDFNFQARFENQQLLGFALHNRSGNG